MATALRPRASASTMMSRYGSQALALGARPGRGVAESVDTARSEMAGFAARWVDTSARMAGFAGQKSVDTSWEMAGFGVLIRSGARDHRRGCRRLSNSR